MWRYHRTLQLGRAETRVCPRLASALHDPASRQASVDETIQDAVDLFVELISGCDVADIMFWGGKGTSERVRRCGHTNQGEIPNGRASLATVVKIPRCVTSRTRLR